MVGDRHVQLCRGNGLFHRLQSSQGSTGNGSPSKVTHTVVGRIQSFVVRWQASVSASMKWAQGHLPGRVIARRGGGKGLERLQSRKVGKHIREG